MPAKELPRALPESCGVDSAALLDFIDAADSRLESLHGLLLCRRGAVIAEGHWRPYRAEERHSLFSLSKSFTSLAIGLAAAEGKLSVEDSVLSFFPESAPAKVSPNLAAMRVRHLLTMTTGHEEDTTNRALRRRDPVKAFLALKVEREPGSHFVYNTGATFVLSAIAQRVTGMRLLDYLEPRLLKPLGIENAVWEAHSSGVDFGGFGLWLKTEDIARLGLLCLGRGEWEGGSLVPAAWIDAATSAQVPNGQDPRSDWSQGYGYQFWRCRHGAYRGDGAFGQFCLVMPERQAVLAITAGVSGMQSVLDLAWDKLLPALRDGELPPAPRAAAELADKLASLEMKCQPGAASSPIAAGVDGISWAFERNDQGIGDIRLDFAGERLGLSFDFAARKLGRQRIECGFGSWIEGRACLPGRAGLGGPPRAPSSQNVAASWAWLAEDTLVVRLCILGTPFVPTMSFRFIEGRVAYALKFNVGFGPKEMPPLEGRPKA